MPGSGFSSLSLCTVCGSAKFYFNWAMFLTQVNKSCHQKEKQSERERENETFFFSCGFIVSLQNCIKWLFSWLLPGALFIRVISWSMDNYSRGQAVIAMNGLSTFGHRIVKLKFLFFGHIVRNNWNQIGFCTPFIQQWPHDGLMTSFILSVSFDRSRRSRWIM